MKAATTEEIKAELQHLPPKKVIELCLRLARFKKENKELLTYLLFEAHNEAGYVDSVKLLMDESFNELPKPTAYLTKKSLRKILRLVNKHNKYVGSKTALAEWLLHFCARCKQFRVVPAKQSAIEKIYLPQLDKVAKLLPSIEEDLQYDYQRQLESLR